MNRSPSLHPIRRLGGRWVVVVGLVTGLALAGGVAAWSAAGASAAASYRTATAIRGSVQQTLTATGTVTPRHQAELSFGTSGTVRTVGVEVGDHVDIGETLAVLDRTALRDAVISAKASVAKAKATLVADTAAQAAAVTAAATASTNTTTSASNGASNSPARSGTSRATRNTLERLGKQQAALLTEQRNADAALQVSAAALTQQAAACEGVLNPDPDATKDPDVAGCQKALGTVQAAQAAVGTAQHKVSKAIDTLTRSLSDALRTVSSSGSSANSSGAQSDGSSGSGADNNSGSSGSADASGSGSDGGGADATSPSRAASSGTVTAATLARDQSSIDTARASLVRATAALDEARLASPIAGTVAAVDVAQGDSVSSSTVAAVVNGDDGNVGITIDVTENDIRAIKVGQSAQVSADGAQAALPARVTSVGLLAASDSGTASYPVVVSLAGAPLSLASGSDATVSVVTATARNVVTVPSSAVTRAASGSTGVVRVLTGDQVASARVEIGAVGPVRTEIVSGLKAGQRVVLADFSAALPSSSTGARVGGGFGGGGFGGGGGGGLGGGGPRTGTFTPRTSG